MINIINILEFCTSPSDRGALASCSWTHSILIAAWLQLESAALPRVGRRVGAQAMHDDGPDLVPGRISSRGGCKKTRFSTRAKTDMRITAKGNLRVVSPAHLPAWAGASKFQGASMESPGRHAGMQAGLHTPRSRLATPPQGTSHLCTARGSAHRTGHTEFSELTS